MKPPRGELCVLLVDGEHYPPVIARAVEGLKARGEKPVKALLVGGGEKLGQTALEIGVPVEIARHPEEDLARLLDETGAGRVIDLSDEPVLGYVERCRLASVALFKGSVYEGSDFEFRPPERELEPGVASVGIIGTGKRTGKTAIAGAAARRYKEAGLSPVVVAMGRGGPPNPELIEAPLELTPERLAEWAAAGRHAASDYIEDALMAGVPTVGAWRAGGGMAGQPSFTNFPAALDEATALSPGLLILEGSGAAIPPAHFDAGVLVVNSGIDPGFLCGYFGLFRLLLADTVVLTMCEETVDPDRLGSVERCLRNRPLSQPKVTRTIFRPYPLGELAGKKILFITTAPPDSGTILRKHLEERWEAKVAGMSHSLADRTTLVHDLESAPEAEVLAVELKAAAVDVVTRFGIDRGMEVIYVDNRPETVGDGDLDELLMETAQMAKERFER